MQQNSFVDPSGAARQLSEFSFSGMQDDPQSSLLIRREPPLGWIILNRPHSRNALTKGLWKQLTAEIQKLSHDDEIRVLLLRGVGNQGFISGADIQELREIMDRGEVLGSAHFTAALIEAITQTPQPVIAMINGDCLGGGLLIALACDLRFASASARFGVPAVKLGLAYPFETGIARMVHLIGPTHTADILLSGRLFEAAEAQEMSLLNCVLAEDQLEHFVRQYALRLAQGAPASLAAHKLAIQNLLRPVDQRNNQVVMAALDHCEQSEDAREGLTAFLEKRTPHFRGR